MRANDPIPLPAPVFTEEVEECPTCKGIGWVPDWGSEDVNPCDTCWGKGKVKHLRRGA